MDTPREDRPSPDELEELTPEELERLLSDAIAEEEHNIFFPDWRYTPFNPADPLFR